MDHEKHIYFIQIALSEAAKALKLGEIPVGSILVSGEKIISKAHNMVEKLHDPTAHAEMLALSSGFEYYGSKNLSSLTLYTTLEPCVMCAGAMYWAKIKTIVFGAYDKDLGAISTGKNILNKSVNIIPGVLSIQSEDFLKKFFRNLRSCK